MGSGVFLHPEICYEVRMLESFARWKEGICSYLDRVKDTHLDLYGSVHQIGPDALDRLIGFAKRGKMIRGGLVCLGCNLFGGTASQDAVAAAAAVELFQSALLIHDDIMDRDEYRRGDPSLFYEYQQVARESDIVDATHLGESLGICVGDIAFFLAFELLSGLKQNSEMVSGLVLQSARELSFVGIAQMADVARGATVSDINADVPMGEILGPEFNDAETIAIYRYKTGRYTFSLPLKIGAAISGCNKQTSIALEEFGENLGILYQLKDDEIGLFGNPDETGKPVGSDIREGKKTLYYHYLFAAANREESEKLEGIFGNYAGLESDVSYALELIAKYSIRDKIEARVKEYAIRAWEICSSIESLSESGRKQLGDLIEYSTGRTR